MKKYRCHKEVNAIKIKRILHGYQGIDGALINSDDENVLVTNEYLTKHKPEIGGYYVKYEGGYESYSPADVFESGYSLIEE